MTLAGLYQVKGSILQYLGRDAQSRDFFNKAIKVYESLGYLD
jgi:hypothetical protein